MVHFRVVRINHVTTHRLAKYGLSSRMQRLASCCGLNERLILAAMARHLSLAFLGGLGYRDSES